ncbi:hypothetical protein E1211_17980 [Micromonospora sp. 15K316]|uniref:hypothetical protein n=1 Tax=Micromonospora sp. 15K316 TaxID=2530376 RepID=UPI0010518083|nr:hypothetical protein [Micromonospora sp. 15K316]TDC34236.1 hypothetical protein E1211_17980 [Micromonospora sp. 15K316]
MPDKVVYNPDQVMAWKLADITALIGRHLDIRVAADPSYWKNLHQYRGPWDRIFVGVVASATLDDRGEIATVTYTDGTWAGWIAGQPVYITVSDPKEQ